MKIKLTLLACILIFIGCSKKYTYSNYTKLKLPEKKIDLQAKVMNKTELLLPSAIKVIDDYLIVIDDKSEKQINIFDIKSGDLLSSFGKLGQGPDEFIGAYNIIPDPRNNKCFWIYDVSTRKLKKFDVMDAIQNEARPKEIVQIKEGNGTPNQLMLTENNELLGIGYFMKGRVSIYNTNGEYIKSVGEIPVRFKEIKYAFQHSHGFHGKFAYKDQSKELLIANLNGAIVENQKIDGQLKSTLVFPDGFFPEYRIIPVGTEFTTTFTEKSRIGFLDICYNKKLNLIFLLYSGEYFFTKDGNRNEKADYSNTIYVLDENNSIIETLILDKGIRAIDFSQSGSSLYGLSENDILEFSYKQ